MQIETANWFSAYKDTITSLQSIATIIGLIIAGIWALRRFYYERPYQGALEITIKGSLFSTLKSANLIHLAIHIKNIGKASIKIGNGMNKSFHSSIKAYAFSKSAELLPDNTNTPTSPVNIDLTESRISYQIIDSDFIEQFRPWFKNRDFAILESGEGETYSLDFALNKSFDVLLVIVTIYEARIKRAIGRPYYWREQALIGCTSST